MEPTDAEPEPSGERSPDPTAGDEGGSPINLEEPASDDRIAALKLGKRITASQSKPRSTWTVSMVLIIGLFLIGAATVGAIIRDAIYLEMLEAKQKSQLKEMQDEFRHFGR